MITTVPRATAVRPFLRLVPPQAFRGEVCVLLDPGRAVVWLHGCIDAELADDLLDAAGDLVEAGLPVTVHAGAMTACDGTVRELVDRLLVAGLPVRMVDPDGVLSRALLTGEPATQ